MLSRGMWPEDCVSIPSRPGPTYLSHMLPYVLPPEEGEHRPGMCAGELEQ